MLIQRIRQTIVIHCLEDLDIIQNLGIQIIFRGETKKSQKRTGKTNKL